MTYFSHLDTSSSKAGHVNMGECLQHSISLPAQHQCHTITLQNAGEVGSRKSLCDGGYHEEII